MSRLLLVLLGAACGCRAPRLGVEPWEPLRAGATTVALRPALFTAYGIDGEFTSMNFQTGETVTVDDDGDVEGRFGFALRVDRFLTDAWVVFLGADYRSYDVERLNPLPDLDIRIDRIDSLQLFLGLRRLFAPLGSQPRLRPFGELSIGYLPGVDVGYEVDLSRFGSSNLDVDAESDGYWIGGASTGLVYHAFDRWFLELGLLYEVPLTALEVDLGFDVSGSRVPLDADLRPSGLIGYWGLSYRP